MARGYWSDHKEFAFQMFPEASTWQADVVRVTGDGDRVPVSEPWSGYGGTNSSSIGACPRPDVRHHADAGVDNQLAFLQAAVDWVAENTERDVETLYLEATVTYWHNDDGPQVVVLRSPERTQADTA